MSVFKTEVVNSTRELTARERVMYRDYTNGFSLNDIEEPIRIIPADYIEIHVENPKSESKEYDIILVIAKDGSTYYTGSENFRSEFTYLFSEMRSAGEEWEIEVYKAESKNYKGKEFLSCRLV